jgi:hypothetical protein
MNGAPDGVSGGKVWEVERVLASSGSFAALRMTAGTSNGNGEMRGLMRYH